MHILIGICILGSSLLNGIRRNESGSSRFLERSKYSDMDLDLVCLCRDWSLMLAWSSSWDN